RTDVQLAAVDAAGAGRVAEAEPAQVAVGGLADLGVLDCELRGLEDARRLPPAEVQKVLGLGHIASFARRDAALRPRTGELRRTQPLQQRQAELGRGLCSDRELLRLWRLENRLRAPDRRLLTTNRSLGLSVELLGQGHSVATGQQPRQGA